MKRIILFSEPQPAVIDKIALLLFPEEFKEKRVAYMPANGSFIKKYLDFWQEICDKNDTRLVKISNSVDDATAEIEKLLSCNILIITGGNTFQLLYNIKKNLLFDAILEFSKKTNNVICGFSAGALILTPTIEICNLPDYDRNEVNLMDLRGLNLVDFAVFPHFSERYEGVIAEYQKSTDYEVRTIRNDEFIVMENGREII